MHENFIQIFFLIGTLLNMLRDVLNIHTSFNYSFLFACAYNQFYNLLEKKKKTYFFRNINK